MMKMNKKNLTIIFALLILANKGYAVTVETTFNLNVYYPEYSKIDLVCGQMPVWIRAWSSAVRQLLQENYLRSSNIVI